MGRLPGPRLYMGRPSYRGEHCRIRCLRGKAYWKEGAEIWKRLCIETTIKQKELNALFPAKNDWGILLGTRQEKQNESIMIATSPFTCCWTGSASWSHNGYSSKKGESLAEQGQSDEKRTTTWGTFCLHPDG
jgi:hypothetical protein